jgi:hypothetical protein
MRARLIVTYECERDCAGCCNKDWKHEPAKKLSDPGQYEMIMITGGEPLLFPKRLGILIRTLRRFSDAKVIVYTATTNGFKEIADLVDGMTMTLHTVSDTAKFMDFVYCNWQWLREYKGSLRLNVFNEARRPNYFMRIPPMFKVKFTDWIKDCPLPEGEVLLELEDLWI